MLNLCRKCLAFTCRNFGRVAVREFEEIPSPRGLPIIGTTLSLLWAGSAPNLHNYIDQRHQQLGPIFREKIGPQPCVFISNPDTIRRVFAHEGKHPVHILPEAWTTYNKLHNVSRGLFFMNGEEWLHFRRILNPLLLKGDLSWLEESCRPAIDGLVEEIRNRDNIRNWEDILYKWSLEVIVSTLIGPEVFREVKKELDGRIGHLASIVHLVFETSSKLSLIPAGIASKYSIPRWKRFESSVTETLKHSADLVDILFNNYTKDQGLLGKLKGKMSLNTLTNIITDLVLAAGDTSTYSMLWLMYTVGQNPEIQSRIRKGDETLLRNILKESLRLYPVAPFLTRIMPETVELAGYRIPAGSVLIMSIFSSGRDERNFPDPLKFDPDRWIRDGGGRFVQSAAMPFAIGARSCIGKKLAETQLQQTIHHLCLNFDFTTLNKVDVLLKLIAVPSKPIHFQFNNQINQPL